MTLFKTANDFSLFIERKAIEQKTTCLQIIMDYCEGEGVDYEDVAKNISKQLKDKLAVEFSDIGLLKKTATLGL